MEESDLEAIGITSAEHRKKILDSAKALPQLTPIGNQSTEAIQLHVITAVAFLFRDQDDLEVQPYHCLHQCWSIAALMVVNFSTLI